MAFVQYFISRFLTAVPVGNYILILINKTPSLASNRRTYHLDFKTAKFTNDAFLAIHEMVNKFHCKNWMKETKVYLNNKHYNFRTL